MVLVLIGAGVACVGDRVGVGDGIGSAEDSWCRFVSVTVMCLLLTAPVGVGVSDSVGVVSVLVQNPR